jgi:hypothetical protein
MTNSARITLPLVPREIAKRTGGPAPSYRRVYAAVLNGDIPTELGANGRWSVAADDLDTVAAAFGVGAKAAA